MTIETQEKTGLGNYFVANYPPFSAWKPAYLPDARAALASRFPAWRRAQTRMSRRRNDRAHDDV